MCSTSDETERYWIFFRYAEYIKKNKIEILINTYDIFYLYDNIPYFRNFIKDNEPKNNGKDENYVNYENDENNKIYLYFKTLYYYCNNECDKIFNYSLILNNEPNYLYLIGNYYKYKKHDFNLMIMYFVKAIWLKNKVAYESLEIHCRNNEKNKLKLYEYINYPKILTLIICNRKSKVKLFLPNELLNIIYVDYMQF